MQISPLIYVPKIKPLWGGWDLLQEGAEMGPIPIEIFTLLLPVQIKQLRGKKDATCSVLNESS